MENQPFEDVSPIKHGLQIGFIIYISDYVTGIYTSYKQLKYILYTPGN